MDDCYTPHVGVGSCRHQEAHAAARQHIGVLYAMIGEEAPSRSTEEWVKFCDRANIPCMPVLTLETLPDDPHVRAVSLFGSAARHSEGAYRTIRRPASFSGAPFRIRRHAPRLGDHTAEILAEIGIAPEEDRKVSSIAPGNGMPRASSTKRDGIADAR